MRVAAAPIIRDNADAAEIIDIADQLAATDLRPGMPVDALFGRLVALACALPPDDPLLASDDCTDRIRRLCAIGEENLERHWAAEVLADPRRIAGFPYRSNYRLLARAEYHAVDRTLQRPLRRLVFAGCGPLPLTAVHLARRYPDLTVTCLDHDPAAAEAAEQVLARLVPGSRVTVRQHDAHDHDYTGADAVLVAALVGDTPSAKAALLERIADRLPPNSLLAARSVPGDGRRLLYPRLPLPALGSRLHAVAEWSPPPGVINSLVLARPAHQSAV